MQMHENPKSKVIAFREGLLREHCVSSQALLAREA